MIYDNNEGLYLGIDFGFYYLVIFFSDLEEIVLDWVGGLNNMVEWVVYDVEGWLWLNLVKYCYVVCWNFKMNEV